MARLTGINVAVPGENVTSTFTPWRPWAERDREEDKIDGSRLGTYSGVYLLAHFAKRAPPGAASPLDANIIYVGEGSNLARRWRYFERSIRGRPGHSAGWTYRDVYGSRPRVDLHVAAFPIWLKRTERDGAPMDAASRTCRLRLYLEQAILWHHVVAHGGAHLLNRK